MWCPPTYPALPRYTCIAKKTKRANREEMWSHCFLFFVLCLLAFINIGWQRDLYIPLAFLSFVLLLKKKLYRFFFFLPLAQRCNAHENEERKGEKKKAQKTPGKEMFSNPVQKTRNIKGGTNALRLYNTIERRGKRKKEVKQKES